MTKALPCAARNRWQQHGIVATIVSAFFCSALALADQDFSGQTVTAEEYHATHGTSTTTITGGGIDTGSIAASGSITAAGHVVAGGVETGQVSADSVNLRGEFLSTGDVRLLGGDLSVLGPGKLHLGAGSGMVIDLGDIELQHGNIDLADGHLSVGNSTLNETGLQIDGGPGLTRAGLDMHGQKVTQVGDGDVASGSADAVNGGQLHATADSLATALGGGASVAADGTVSMPSYDFGGHSYAGVGATFVAIDDAFAAMDSAASSLATTQVVAGQDSVASGANTAALGDHAVASGDRSIALGAGSVASRPNTVSVGAPGAQRQITNVAPATHGTDAVNLYQLEAATTRMKKYSARAAAASMAQPSIPYLDAG